MYVNKSVKRACVNWGIGRELYTAPKIFISLDSTEMTERNGKTTVSPSVTFIVKEIGYDSERNINHLIIVDKKGAVRYQMGQAQPQASDDFKEKFQNFIIPALAQAKTEEEVKGIWDSYKDYQRNQTFIQAVNRKLQTIRNVA